MCSKGSNDEQADSCSRAREMLTPSEIESLREDFKKSGEEIRKLIKQAKANGTFLTGEKATYSFPLPIPPKKRG